MRRSFLWHGGLFAVLSFISANTARAAFPKVPTAMDRWSQGSLFVHAPALGEQEKIQRYFQSSALPTMHPLDHGPFPGVDLPKNLRLLAGKSAPALHPIPNAVFEEASLAESEPGPDTDLDDPTSALGISPCARFFDGLPELSLGDEPVWAEAPEPRVVPSTHTEKDGSVVEYDQIPRRWDRPGDYRAYQYPVLSLADHPVASGYDLDKPDAEQRRGRMNAIGHGGVDLAQTLGAPIRAVALSHQVGPGEVIFTGDFWGNTVLSLHTVREASKLRKYVVIWAHLEGFADNLSVGTKLYPGTLVGTVGNTGSPDFVHLHWEARRVRPGVTFRLRLDNFMHKDVTVVTDPRNVLPLRTKARIRPPCHAEWRRERLAHWFGNFAAALGTLNPEGPEAPL